MKIKFKIIILTLIIMLSSTILIFSGKFTRVSITSDPSGAQVFISFTDKSFVTPTTYNFRNGVEYQITIRKSGYESKTINHKGGSDNEIHIRLKKKNNNSNNKFERADITSSPSGADVSISFTDHTYKTPTDYNFRVGVEYTLTFSKKGYKNKTITYTGGEGNIHVNLKKKDDNSNNDNKVKVKIESNPEGARFWIDGDDDKSYYTPEILKFKTGREYKIKFHKKGYIDKKIKYIGGEGNIFVELEKKTQKIKANITSDPSGAKFYIGDDDDEKYKTPETLEFKKGKEYVITFNKKGYKKKRVTYVGGEGNLHVRLQQQSVTLIIESNVDDANVFIDGENVGKTPAKLELEPGTYEIIVNKKGFRRYKKTIEVTGDMEIYAKLQRQNIISIKLPNGAQIYINGEKQKINWKNNNDKWKVFTFSGDNEVNEIKVIYHGMSIEKNVKFDGKQVQLMLDLK